MPPSPAPSPAFDDLVEESLDEAAFLWRRWEAELVSLTRSLDEVWSWTEDRLHGALDGVRAAGPRLVDVGIAATGVRGSRQGRRRCGVARIECRSRGHRCARRGTSSDRRTATDARSSGDWSCSERPRCCARPPPSSAERGTPRLQAALCRLKTFLRSAPGPELAAAFESEDVDARADAARATACLPPKSVEEWVSRGLASTDPVVRHAAAEAGTRRGIQAAWRVATRQAAVLDADAAPYLRLLALLGSSSDHDIVYAALRVPALQRQAVWALGHIGTVKAAETCLAGMKHEPLARECGEAYAWITGADLRTRRPGQG